MLRAAVGGATSTASRNAVSNRTEVLVALVVVPMPAHPVPLQVGPTVTVIVRRSGDRVKVDPAKSADVLSVVM